ncbi:MAG: hypothetical protein HKN34_06025 [Gammaproteobacteria bacterium]|nr:hypothetical protein [Gammaproteobacteria bacterium]
MAKHKFLIVIAPLFALLSTVVNATGTTTGEQMAQPGNAVQFNMFDPTAWFGAYAQPSAETDNFFQAAHPATWMQFVDPKKHQQMHMNFSNPAYYSQFMQPGFYMQFMNPQNWMAWMNPASYAKMFDPAVITHWMNPASYMHVMDPSMYSQLMNPAAYTALIKPITEPLQDEITN